MLDALARPAVAGLLLLSLVACARYTPLPLDPEARYAASLDDLRQAPAPGTRLGADDVTRLVLANNPSLRLAGTRRAEARAQADADARPPNPSFSGGIGYLLSGAGDATAWTAALSQPVNGWITLRARRDEANATVREVDASVAWEAWQAVAKARLLVAGIALNEQLLAAQEEMGGALREQAAALSAARQRGDMDSAVLSPVAQAASEAGQATAETERTLATQRRDLHALMGLSYDAPLTLAPLPTVAPLDEDAARKAIDTLPARRPDLIALAMGYGAEDARFRAAILTQFPALSVGYAGSRDNSRVTNGGPEVTLDLPVFDHGTTQANAAGATRQRLHDEYSQRIADARDEALALVAANRVAEGQLARMDNDTAGPGSNADGAARAFARGDLDRTAYTDMVVATRSRKIALLRTELAIREQRIGLETILGIGMPAIDINGGTP
jgi:outer membrane protein TolC